MRTLNYVLPLFLIIGLFSCEGSDVYRGDWKGIDKKGQKVEINFDASVFTISKDGDMKSHEYTQNQVKITNGVKTYGIQTEGRELKIHFPISGEDQKATILDANGYILYTMGRSEYVTYDDIYTID